jgi:hypothetical protein
VSNYAKKPAPPVEEKKEEIISLKPIRVVENGIEKELTNKGVKKVKLDQYVDSDQLLKIIVDKTVGRF